MTQSTTLPESTTDTERQDAANAAYADEHHTSISSFFGMGIVVALLVAMMFLQASAATSLL